MDAQSQESNGESSTSPRRSRRVITVEVILAVVAIAGGLTGVLSLVRDATDWHFSSSTSSDGAITIDDPTDGTLPFCASLTGSAPQQEKSHLWVAYRHIGDDEYYFRKTIHDEGDHWETTRFALGNKDSTGQRYEFYAFFVAEDIGVFMESLRARSTDDKAGAYYFATRLPPGVSLAPTKTFSRNSNIDAGC